MKRVEEERKYKRRRKKEASACRIYCTYMLCCGAGAENFGRSRSWSRNVEVSAPGQLK
jgi:hypothetical protein